MKVIKIFWFFFPKKNGLFFLPVWMRANWIMARTMRTPPVGVTRIPYDGGVQ